MIGKSALEDVGYEYTVGFFTHPDFKYGADGVEDAEDFIKFKELNDYFLKQGCEVNEDIYIKW